MEILALQAGLRRELPKGPDQPSSNSRWLECMAPGRRTREGMLREKARDNSGHWVIEETLGSEVEEGHCWICLWRKITDDYARMAEGKEQGL